MRYVERYWHAFFIPAHIHGFLMQFMIHARGLQTTARGPNPARDVILSIMKNDIFMEHLLIWRNVTHRKIITLRKMSGPRTVVYWFMCGPLATKFGDPDLLYIIRQKFLALFGLRLQYHAALDQCVYAREFSKITYLEAQSCVACLYQNGRALSTTGNNFGGGKNNLVFWHCHTSNADCHGNC